MAKDSAGESLNHAYFLCLIDWENKILNPEEFAGFAAKIMCSNPITIDDWKKEKINWSEFLVGCVVLLS